MKKVSLAGLLGLLAFLGACGVRTRPVKVGSAPSAGSTLPASATVRVGIPDRGRFRVIELPLEDYVIGAALAELSLGGVESDAAERMLEVQLILARTYAVTNRQRHAADGFDLCAATHCQLFKPSAGSRGDLLRLAQAAASRTKGTVILHHRTPIQALYHANCGGHTSAAHDIWSGPSRPYLRGVSDTFCVRHQPLEWRWSETAANLRDAFNSHPETRITGRLDRIEVMRHDRSGRASTIAIGRDARQVSGTTLRGLLLQHFGAASLRSTWFEVRKEGDLFVFEGRGNGHGAGLCQAGALERARAGQSADAILRHYFPGTVTGPLESGRASTALRSDSHGSHPRH